MTIEELREMRGAIGTLAYLNGETASPYLMPNNGLCKSLLELINAEIARQDVADEDIQEAMQRAKSRNRCAELYLEDVDKSDKDYEFWKNYYERKMRIENMMIDALRQYRKPAPCDWCVQFDDEQQERKGAIYSTKRPNYCPMCGRKLVG